MAAGGRMWMFLLSMLAEFCVTWGLEYCEGNYWCDKGHCCGKGKCCTYNYYELWWFWVIWLTIALLGCCCFYQRKRLHRRRRRASDRSSRRSRRSHTEATLQSPHVTANAQQAAQLQFYPPVFEPGKVLHLPTYEEVSDLPKDPPSYNLLYRTTLPQTDLSTPHQQTATTGDVEPTPPASSLSGCSAIVSVSCNPGAFQHAERSDSNQQPPLCTTHLDSCTSEVDDSLSANLLENAVEPSVEELEHTNSTPAVVQGEPPPYTPYTTHNHEESTTG